jgi:hypothetical protein
VIFIAGVASRHGTSKFFSEVIMGTEALFGLSILMSFVALAIVTKVHIWPRLREVPRRSALIALVTPTRFASLA